MTRVLRIVADDLTGALDAAAPFATPERPVLVPWRDKAEAAERLVAVSSESREMAQDAAVRATLDGFRGLAQGAAGALWFKKVDSVMRGHPVAETAALIRKGGFRRCIFAPAFPEMGRITRGGRQLVLGPEGERQVGPEDLVAAFAAEGLDAARPGEPGDSEARVLVGDASRPGDLDGLVRREAGAEGLLWAGSRGLAAALAGPSRWLSVPRIGAVIVGTSHPATRAQVQALAGLVVRAGPGGTLAADPERPLLVDPVPDARDAAETRERLSQAMGRLSGEAGIVVVGGESLSTVLKATRAGGLRVLGEVAPGLPLVRVQGGTLDGRQMVTKSGGFGPPDLLRSLLAGACLVGS